jgi:FlaA1/EpsC-like NDP-sugar epimerase
MDQSGRRVRIDFTGLRDGEKLHEELFGDGEPHDVRPVHPQVSHVPVPPIDEHAAISLPVSGSAADVRDRMAAMCRPAGDPAPQHGYDYVS